MSDDRFNASVKDPPTQQGPSKAQQQAASRAAARARARLVEDVESLCRDAGVPFAVLARAAGISHGYLDRIMAGKAAPSIETYARLAIPLGADLATRLYPNTGPLIHDRHQATIVEALLGQIHPRWQAFTEVPVWKPARGAIDVVLHEAREGVFLAVEVESDIRRIEQQVRWARLKADSLPSWSQWPAAAATRTPGAKDDVPLVSQVLIVRKTRATSRTADEFARQLTLAYPAHPEDALAALVGTSRWPGSVLLWALIDAQGARFLRHR